SSTVRVNGQSVIRHGDPFTMNAGNTIGKLVYVEGAGGVASIDEATTSLDEEEGFFDWVADTLDATVDKTAEVAGNIVDKAQALNEQYAIVTRAEGLAQGVFGTGGIIAGATGIVALKPATTAGGAVLVAIGADNAGAGFTQLFTGENQQTLVEQATAAVASMVTGDPGKITAKAGNLAEKSKKSGKIDANPGDGIKVKGAKKEPPDPNKTKICIGYTKAPGHKLHGQYHAFVTAENPLTGEKYITRAGPSADGLLGSSSASSSSASGGSLSASAGDGGSGGFGFGTIRAQYGIWSEKLPFDKPSNTIHQQCLGEIDLPYDQVVNRMQEFAQVTNKNEIPYVPWGPNSNSYAFTFLESLGMPRPEPDISALGHSLGSPSKKLSYYP
ncbi:MAG: hypothetical protein LGR52_11620, partial [Candidatus Thiosymbion ectosymbiont of Robbea hypermnestra]|nr:hypothetical protein [Candidatus Thiosymbion ectosymbiont of Robbea hypermnestra]